MYFHVINTLINQNVLLFKNYSTIKHLLLCQSYCPQHQWSVPFFCSVFCRAYFLGYCCILFTSTVCSFRFSPLIKTSVLYSHSCRPFFQEAEIWSNMRNSHSLTLFVADFCVFLYCLVNFVVLVAHKRRFLPLYLIEQQEWTGKDMEQAQTLSAAWSPAQP